MAWTIVGIAVLTEIMWALSLKWASGQATWTAAVVPIVLNFANMGLLASAMRDLPAGTVYAVWTGLGAVGVTTLGWLVLGEDLNLIQAIFIGLIVVGVVGTKFYATA